MAPGSPTNGEDCHPIVTASLLEAFAGADTGDVETDHAEDWTVQLLLKSAVKWIGKSLSPPAPPEVRLDGYDSPHYSDLLPWKLPAHGWLGE